MLGRVVLVMVVVAAALIVSPVRAATYTNWPGYLFGARHSNVNEAATAITPATAGNLTQKWHWKPAAPTQPGQPGPILYASPTVYRGVIYIGADTGVFYALNESTGHVIWHKLIGFTKSKTCNGKGFVSTATVAPDPSRGGQLTVYVGAANGYLYALKASDGTVVWRSRVMLPSASVSDYFNWSSPTVSGGNIYVGISSDCDDPLVRGGVKAFSQSSGQPFSTTYHTVPAGAVGGSIWSSLVADSSTNSVIASTGNADPNGTQPGDSFSIVRLSRSTLTKQDSWTVSPSLNGTDYDFGSSPTLFYANLSGSKTELVGACNKNGVYYALRVTDLSAGPVWQDTIGDPGADNNSCLASGIWDFANGRLYLAGNRVTIDGTKHAGSIREVDPSTGIAIWTRYLSGGPVMGSPAMNGGGVIAAGTLNRSSLSANRVYLINASTGALLRQFALGSQVFAQPVFADKYLLMATVSKGLYAFGP
jgi:outer membrane protein assembly factor BamB